MLWVFLLWIVFTIGIVLGVLAERSYALWKHQGEAMVANLVSSRLQCPHTLINNVTLETTDGTTQIDHILVVDTGIFIIETKHYSGWIFGDPASPFWTQVIYKKKTKFRNPLRQNYGHLKAVQALFNLPADAFSSLVVFTGEAEFKTNLGPDVVKLGQLIDRIGVDRLKCFDERQMTYIVGRIEMKRMRRSIETDEYHLNHVRTRVARAQTS